MKAFLIIFDYMEVLEERYAKTVFKRNPESHQYPFQDEQVFGIRKDDVCKPGGGENISIIPVGSFCPKMDTSA